MPPGIAGIENDRAPSALPSARGRGFRVLGPHDGTSVSPVCIPEEPDAIVPYVAEPEISGSAVCQQLRECPRLRDTPLAFLADRAGEAETLRGLEVEGKTPFVIVTELALVDSGIHEDRDARDPSFVARNQGSSTQSTYVVAQTAVRRATEVGKPKPSAIFRNRFYWGPHLRRRLSVTLSLFCTTGS